MYHLTFLRVIFVLSLGLFWLSRSHAIPFENCPSQGPMIFGSYSTQERNPSTNGYNTAIGGFGFLWDIYSLEFIKFGVGLSAATSRIELGNNAISISEIHKIDYVVPAGYTRLHYGWAFLSLSAGGGPAHFKTARIMNAPIQQVNGKFNGMLGTVRGTVGISIPIDHFEITPLLTIDHGKLRKGINVEKDGNGNVVVITNGKQIRAQQQSFGIRFAEISEPNIFYPEFHIFSYTDSHKEKLQAISRFIDGIPSFVQEGITPVRSGLNLGGSITSTALGETVFLTAGFDYETRKGYQGYSAFLRLRFY